MQQYVKRSRNVLSQYLNYLFGTITIISKILVFLFLFFEFEF